MKQDGIKRGSYNVCKKRLINMGFSELEAEMICAKKFFSDQEETPEPDHHSSNRMNLMFVNSYEEDSKGCVSHKISILHDEHPKWDHDRIVAAAHSMCGVSKKHKDDIEPTPSSEVTGGKELKGRASPSRSTRVSPFSQMMKLVKMAKGLKVGGMGLVPFKVELPMKNLNRLQTKFEKLFTMEQQNLTAEELAKRAEYAKLMKKSDAELLEEDWLKEFVDDLNISIEKYKEQFPEADDDQVERFLFGMLTGINEDDLWVTDQAEFGDANTGLNNIDKAPIILAVEGVQWYDIEQPDGSKKREWHFKPYEELAMAIDGVDKLSMILEHVDGWTDLDTMGCVRQLVADPNIIVNGKKQRGIRGMGYFIKSKTPEPIKTMLAEKKPIKVSIGFRARRAESGSWNGYNYDFTQRDILLDHLAIILKSIPRCDIDKCGVNLEMEISTDSQEITNINKPNYYYNINKLIYDSLEETKNKTNITDLKKGDSMTDQTDSIDHPQSWDFNKYLKRLQEFIDEGKVAAEDIEAATKILTNTKFGDNMDQKEFDDAIALKDAEIKKLESEIGERISKILTVKKFTDSYTDDELSKMTLDQLSLLEDAVSRFNPSDKKPEVIPVAGKSEEVRDAGKKLEREDPRKMFAKTNEEFELYGFYK